MDIRFKALGKMLFYILVIFGANAAINWLFPVYGTMIILSIIVAYLMHIMYSIILDDMAREENKND